jgi:two-component system, NarL family, nitrate/nitrite response regulator NarL
MNKITVLLADDHVVIREGLRALLETEADLEVVGEAQTGRQAVQLTKRLLPAVVVMDIAMPLLNGLEATRQILKAVPATRVLILSAHRDEEYVDEVIRLGAAGYLIKQTSAQVLPKAIREAYKGKAYFDPVISERLANRQQNAPRGVVGWRKKGSVRLTSREVEIIQLIAEGKANKQTADELGISIKTVEKHRQNLMSKLNVHDTAGLTRYAIASGIIESGVRIVIE